MCSNSGVLIFQMCKSNVASVGIATTRLDRDYCVGLEYSLAAGTVERSGISFRVKLQKKKHTHTHTRRL